MKKLFLFLIILILLTGCAKESEDDIKNSFLKKIDSGDSYFLKGNLELRNNDEVYNYLVEVSYEKKSNYKVSLTNKANDSVQIILKNNDGVYVMTHKSIQLL